MKNLFKRGLIPFHYDRKPAKQTTTRTLAHCATEFITAVKGFFYSDPGLDPDIIFILLFGCKNPSFVF